MGKERVKLDWISEGKRTLDFGGIQIFGVTTLKAETLPLLPIYTLKNRAPLHSLATLRIQTTPKGPLPPFMENLNKKNYFKIFTGSPLPLPVPPAPALPPSMKAENQNNMYENSLPKSKHCYYFPTSKFHLPFPLQSATIIYTSPCPSHPITTSSSSPPLSRYLLQWLSSFIASMTTRRTSPLSFQSKMLYWLLNLNLHSLQAIKEESGDRLRTLPTSSIKKSFWGQFLMIGSVFYIHFLQLPDWNVERGELKMVLTGPARRPSCCIRAKILDSSINSTV